MGQYTEYIKFIQTLMGQIPCVCVCVCVRACVRACVRVCVCCLKRQAADSSNLRNFKYLEQKNSACPTKTIDKDTLTARVDIYFSLKKNSSVQYVYIRVLFTKKKK